jgi:multisubunit Na+/H+ antiporter MnhC subunit
VTALGFGIGLGIGAAIVAVFGLGFAFATIAAALATFLSTWLALLILTLGLFALAGVLGLLALGKIRKGTPPVPEEAIREAKLTSEALKANGR